MTVSPPALDAEQELLRSFDLGQHRTLAAALADPQITPAVRGRWQAALAARGAAPVIDALVAARRAQAGGEPDAAARAADAALVLRRAGFPAIAAGLDGPVAPVAPTTHDRSIAAERRASTARAHGERLQAAAASADAATLGAQGDRAAETALAAAHDAWLAGEPARARQLWASVRDDPDAARPLRTDARAAVDAADAHEESGPDWVAGANGAALDDGMTIDAALRSLLGIAPVGAATTASELRAALGREGAVTVRACPDQSMLAAALSVPGVVVLLEEERADAIVFAVVTGMDRIAQLVETWTPGEGVRVSSWATRTRLGAAAGGGALFVVRGDSDAVAALAAAGIVDDARLATVDLATFDPDDPEVPHAAIEQRCRQAIAAAPDLPVGHRRLGETLLALNRLGRLPDDEPHLARWTSETCESFPDAEWPLQLHAEMLEHQGRWNEALIAWADAGRIDPDDWRNHLGQARAMRATGRPGASEMLRRALTLAPRRPEAWRWLAEEELAGGDLDAAGAALELAAEIEPDAPEVAALAATVAERRGDRSAARAHLHAACGDAPEVGQSMRLWRHLLWEGELEPLRDLTRRRFLDPFPGSPVGWSLDVDAALLTGDRDAALERLDRALQHCDLSGDLLDSAAEVLAHLVAPDDVDAALRSLEERLAGRPGPLVQLAGAVGFNAAPGATLGSLGRLVEAYPNDVNAVWSLAQVLADRGRPEDRDRVGAALDRTQELVPMQPMVRILHAWHHLDEDPDAVLALLDPIADAVPALAWDLMARAHDRAGRAADADAVRDRLPAVVDGVTVHCAFLCQVGLTAVALDLGAAELDQAGDAAELAPRIEHARTLLRAGRAADALRVLETAHARWPDALAPVAHLALAAAAAGDAERAVSAASQAFERSRADSFVHNDPWRWLAIAAGAGDGPARDLIDERVPQHTLALRYRARAARQLAMPTAADDLAALAAIAPGSAATIDQRPER